MEGETSPSYFYKIKYMQYQIQDNIESLLHKRRQNTINLYIIVVLLIVALIVSLPWIKIDITNQSRGIIKSTYDNTAVISPISGKVVKNYIQNNNQAVKKGDTLFIIDSRTVQNDMESASYIQHQVQSQINDINRLTNGSGQMQTDLFKQDQQMLAKKLEEAKININQTKSIFDDQKQLYQEGMISRIDFEKAQKDYQIAQNSAEQIKQQHYRQLQETKKDLLIQAKTKSIELDQQKLQQNNYIIKATEDGTIVGYKPVQTNGFIASGASICEISPKHSLIVECYISPSDIGLVRKEQSVKFQIDAYNYNQWGLASGKVIDIDQNITMDRDNYFFKVRCLMDRDFLTLKNGYKGDISKGMTLTARFLIANRSLWQLLYDKVDNWLNPKFKSSEAK